MSTKKTTGAKPKKAGKAADPAPAVPVDLVPTATAADTDTVAGTPADPVVAAPVIDVAAIAQEPAAPEAPKTPEAPKVLQQKALSVRARGASIRRCGIRFVAEPVILDLDALSVEQIQTLRADPNLIVENAVAPDQVEGI